jgi:hypothetical protein
MRRAVNAAFSRDGLQENWGACAMSHNRLRTSSATAVLDEADVIG